MGRMRKIITIPRKIHNCSLLSLSDHIKSNTLTVHMYKFPCVEIAYSPFVFQFCFSKRGSMPEILGRGSEWRSARIVILGDRDWYHSKSTNSKTQTQQIHIRQKCHSLSMRYLTSIPPIRRAYSTWHKSKGSWETSNSQENHFFQIYLVAEGWRLWGLFFMKHFQSQQSYV